MTGTSRPRAVDAEGWTCPVPLRDTPTVVMGHGGGGQLSADLVANLFLPAFGPAGPAVAAGSTDLAGSAGSTGPAGSAGSTGPTGFDGSAGFADSAGFAGAAGLAGPADLGDSAVLPAQTGRLAFTTDSYVVKPLFFPGGCIGDLAVNGTINDLAMVGARPLFLSTAFVLAEGTPMADLGRIAAAMGAAADRAGVRLVTGDTKVVDHGSADGVFVTTAGIGVLADGVQIAPSRARPGDAVLISGSIGEHGMAVLSCREGLQFDTPLRSDTAPLHGLVAALLEGGVDVHVLRDPTRGGVAATTNEIARSAGVGIDLIETALPIPGAVRDACGLLGLDPLQVANEGKLVAIVAADDADAAVAILRRHPLGRAAARIGTVTADHPGLVVCRTALGGSRVLGLPIGEQLPRIC